jgi:hypothetical protein
MKKLKLILVDGETATFYLNGNVTVVGEKYVKNVVIFDGSKPNGWMLHPDYTLAEIEHLIEKA